MSKALKNNVLVLNKSWTAISVANIKKIIKKAIKGKARLLDENFNLYTWEEWLLSEKIYTSSGKIPLSENKEVFLPLVVILNEYNGIPKREIRLNRKNIMIRDKFICQYTGEKHSPSNLTVDHVIPKSLGGKTSWDNLVTCHWKINQKKGDKTPEKANLKLISTPKKPGYHPFFNLSSEQIHDFWTKFIKLH